MSKRQSFSKEFKLEAVRLLDEGKKPAADIARELGIPRNQRGILICSCLQSRQFAIIQSIANFSQ